MNPHTVRDRIAFRSTLEPLKTPAFGVLHALQLSPKDVQIEALGLTLAVLCRGVDLCPHDVVSRSKRQLAEADAVRNPVLEAIEDYAAGELR